MNYRWIVDFEFRVSNEQQRSIIENLGPMAHDVVRLWSRLILPDCHVFEPCGQPIRRVAFQTRAAARRFINIWGGRLSAVVNATTEA